MLAKTHVLGGLAAGLGVAVVTTADPFLIVGASVIGSLIPDIDHAGSKAGRNLPVLSFLFSKIFGHRTFSHSVVFLLATYALLIYLTVHTDITTGLLVGMVSHYALDALTKRGIKLFYPLRIDFGLPIFKTGKTGEKVVAFCLAAVSLWLLLLLVPDILDSIESLVG